MGIHESVFSEVSTDVDDLKSVEEQKNQFQNHPRASFQPRADAAFQSVEALIASKVEEIGSHESGNDHSSNTHIEKRQAIDRTIQYTNTVGFRLLEAGAEVGAESKRIYLDFVTVITTNPLHWHAIQIQKLYLTKLLKKVCRFLIPHNSFKKRQMDNITTCTKMQYLEEEIVRLHAEMKRFKTLTGSSTGSLSDESSSVQSLHEPCLSSKSPTEEAPERTPRPKAVADSMIRQERIALENYAAIPMPPSMKSHEPSLQQPKESEATMKVYTRRLPPAKNFTSAIRMGAAIKLRKVQGPRSPGGTVLRHGEQQPTSTKKRSPDSSMKNMLSVALEERFKHVDHQAKALEKDDDEDWDDDDEEACTNPLLQALRQHSSIQLNKQSNQPSTVVEDQDPLLTALKKAQHSRVQQMHKKVNPSDEIPKDSYISSKDALRAAMARQSPNKGLASVNQAA